MTASGFRCAVVVPVYNEARAVESTVRRLQSAIATVPDASFEIVCVDDGSTDGSGDVLARLDGITVVRHAVNRGYGASLRSGIHRSPQEWIFIVDADGTYPIEDLPRFVEEVRAGGLDMVVGARGGVGITSAPFRAAARWVLRRMVRALTGTPVPDLNSGMRLFRRQLFVEFQHLLPRGFSFTTTLTVASLFSGYALKYLPIDYAERIGKSNIRPVQDFFGFVVLIVRLATYFEPLRFFVPLAGVLALVGALRAARDIAVTNGIGSLATILLLAALQVFITGILADAVIRRSFAPPSEPTR